ncbi:MAG: apolipoprotein N-acyltransferase, partial [Verrucomicrobia bacterium]
MAAARNTSTAADADSRGPALSGPSASPGHGRWRRRAWVGAVWLSTAVFHTVAFPPFELPEAAYVFAVAALLWVGRRPLAGEAASVGRAAADDAGDRPLEPVSLRTLLSTVGSAAFVSWAVLLEWLHHVTIVGTIALAFIVSVFTTAWFAAAWWAVPRMRRLDSWGRIVAALGLAGCWVVLEWTRTWLFTGFPWLPLAASQWQRPIMLQSAAFGGAWAVSFSLVLFNIGLAAYLERLVAYVRRRASRWCPEFYLGLAVLFAGSFGLYRETINQQREPLFRAGFMQPDIPQEVKWDPAEARSILEVLRRETLMADLLAPDVVFWPEATMPLPIVGNEAIGRWVEALSRQIDAPIVFGAVAYEFIEDAAFPDGRRERWRNAVAIVDPDLGMMRDFYAKRHLVPFGEYVPLRRFFPFLEKVVPVGGDFEPGDNAEPLPLRTPGRTTYLGVLICYEDVFPGLARESVRAGAQLLFVATNDAWYGERGAAYQHAAHSVLRAVETRRPVLR